MVRQLLISSLLLILIIPAFAAAQEGKRDPYDGGGDKYGEIRPYKVTPVKTINIGETGKWSDRRSSSDETQQDCAAFKPRETDVREFFHRARRVSFSKYLNLDASRCYAAGEIVFKNGERGTWVIDAGRRGVLTLPEGINLYFFCTKCRAKVFYEY